MFGAFCLLTIFSSSNLDVLAGASATILDYEVILKINTHTKDEETESGKEPGTS